MKEKVDRGIHPEKINNMLIKVITGPRRAGKSFFAIHTLNRLDIFGYAKIRPPLEMAP